MAEKGDTIRLGAPSKCPDCGMEVQIKVMVSIYGWYVGTRCKCGPYTRESYYYSSKKDAQRALDQGEVAYRDEREEYYGETGCLVRELYSKEPIKMPWHDD